MRGGGVVPLENIVTRPRNVGDATITGLELGLTRRLASGLGILATATFTDSGIDIASAFGTLDFGLTYSLGESLELFAEGVNLTDSRQAAYQGRRSKAYQIHHYGPTYNLGLRVRF